MSFHRGAALSTGPTLGYADTADLGPTAGNGFYTRWPDDLALLLDVGITDIRLTLDWARLQQRPGKLDGDWVEHFDNVLEAAAAIGLRTWATLHEESIPRWFDNEGGMGSDDALTKWWPRWVERVAETFGDRVHGWVPFASIPTDAPEQPWSDTWGILAGGPPVVASFDADDLHEQLKSRYVGNFDRLGICMDVDPETLGQVGDDDLGTAIEHWGSTLRLADELLDREGLVITRFTPDRDDAAAEQRITESFVSAVDTALDDRIDVEVCFIEPAIAGPASAPGLLDQQRALTPAAGVYLAERTTSD